MLTLLGLALIYVIGAAWGFVRSGGAAADWWWPIRLAVRAWMAVFGLERGYPPE